MRALRILLILGSVFAIVFVAADRISVNFAEGEAADRIQARQGIAGHTSVDIRGFPFLTQLLDKRLDNVDLRLSGVQAGAEKRGQVVISEMSATLQDVRIGSGFGSATAGAAEGSALIGYDQFNEKSGEKLKLTYAGDGNVKVAAVLDVGGRVVEATATARVTADHDTIGLEVVDAEGVSDELREAVDFTYVIGGLPAGLRMNGATATVNGVSIKLTGRDVALAG